jgi:Ca-activated chloride channel homolog
MMLRTTLILITLFIGTNAVAAEHPDESYRQGKYKEAMSGYEKLDLDHPKDITYRFNRGCAAYQLKDYQRAQAAFSSVYARAQDNSMRFKAAYNLGNTAFQAGDLQTAVQYYKEALRLNTQDTDARYNLELALRKIELAKKEQDQNKQQGGTETQKEDKKNQEGQQGQEQPTGKDGKQNQPPPQDQKSPEGQQQKPEQQGQGRQDQTQGQAQPPPGEQETAGRQEPQDLSGELKAASPAPQQEGAGVQAQQQPAPSVERQKADALLDNIQEDRTRYLQLQVPEDKRDGVKSGKFW